MANEANGRLFFFDKRMNKLFIRASAFLKQYKYIVSFLLLAVSVIVLLFVIVKSIKAKHQKRVKTYQVVHCDRSKYATVPIESVRLMNDKNDVQLLHAQANGLEKCYTSNRSFVEDSDKLVAEQLLVHIKNNPLYRIKNLTHSYPFVTPEMADLLNEIATVFHAKLEEKGIGHYLFYITSALRTTEFQQELTGRNRNAANTSAHLYGATVDITYKEYFNTHTALPEQNYAVGDALRETMLDLRKACRLVVVRERRQACYHFTVVNCDPKKIPHRSQEKM